MARRAARTSTSPSPSTTARCCASSTRGASGCSTSCAEAELAQHRWLRHLGLEPLAPGFDGPALLGRLAGRRSALKVALMDQRLVVGVGNIYASESLFRARLSPRRLALSLGTERSARLAVAIRAVLLEAIEAGGSSLA